MSRDGWSCWTSEKKLKSSAKAFLFFLLVAWGTFGVFFFFSSFFPWQTKVLTLPVTPQAGSTIGAGKAKIPFPQQPWLRVFDGNCWELFIENPQDTNHIHLIPIKCPQNPALGNDQGGIPLLTIFGSPI